MAGGACMRCSKSEPGRMAIWTSQSNETTFLNFANPWRREDIEK